MDVVFLAPRQTMLIYKLRITTDGRVVLTSTTYSSFPQLSKLSSHRSMLPNLGTSGDLYELLLDETKTTEGLAIVADTAFPRNGPLARKIVAPMEFDTVSPATNVTVCSRAK